jgi:hypothetical protein
MTAAGRKAMSKMKLRVGSDEQKEHVAIQLVNLDTGKALGAILLDGASAEHHFPPQSTPDLGLTRFSNQAGKAWIIVFRRVEY